MKVNKTTLLFEDFSEEQREEMKALAVDIVLNGNIPYPRPVYITMWMEAAGFDDRQFLLTMSTLFPARLALSLVVN